MKSPLLHIGGLGRAFVLAVSMASVVVGCGGEIASTTEGSYVGHLSNSDADIAVVADGSSLVAYVCGGSQSYSTLTRWFIADPQNGLHVERDGWVLDGSLGSEGWQGTLLSPEGQSFPWAASMVSAGSDAGLYQANSESGKAGVIVHESGEQIEIQGAYREKIGRVLQVTPVMPIHVEAGSLLVSVSQPDGEQTFRVERVYTAAH
ncbi:MAG: hypothetical protein U0165_02825 [Polyangiaceae bacterium]